jgi:hypothetical protein
MSAAPDVLGAIALEGPGTILVKDSAQLPAAFAVPWMLRAFVSQGHKVRRCGPRPDPAIATAACRRPLPRRGWHPAAPPQVVLVAADSCQERVAALAKKLVGPARLAQPAPELPRGCRRARSDRAAAGAQGIGAALSGDSPQLQVLPLALQPDGCAGAPPERAAACAGAPPHPPAAAPSPAALLSPAARPAARLLRAGVLQRLQQQLAAAVAAAAAEQPVAVLIDSLPNLRLAAGSPGEWLAALHNLRALAQHAQVSPPPGQAPRVPAAPPAPGLCWPPPGQAPRAGGC